MATKILNLDKLRVAREVVFGGRTFKVLPLTVGEFIESANMTEKLEAMSPIERMGEIVKFVGKHVEDMTAEQLNGLDLELLMQIAAFLRGSDENTENPEPKAVEGNVTAQ